MHLRTPARYDIDGVRTVISSLLKLAKAQHF